MNRVLLEVAVETLSEAVAAAESGADRLELCSRLDLGGLTPALEHFHGIRAAVAIPIVVMIRARAGQFVVCDTEVVQMIEAIATFAPAQPDGFVFGALTSGESIDRHACDKLVEACGSIPAIFHRAWDERRRSPEELDVLIDLGFRRLLTSGGESRAPDGAGAIREWVQRSAGRIEILPGAGITPMNVSELIRSTGCTQVHGTFKNCVRAARLALDHFAGAG